MKDIGSNTIATPLGFEIMNSRRLEDKGGSAVCISLLSTNNDTRHGHIRGSIYHRNSNGYTNARPNRTRKLEADLVEWIERKQKVIASFQPVFTASNLRKLKI
jgi:hypothetical protein